MSIRKRVSVVVLALTCFMIACGDSDTASPPSTQLGGINRAVYDIDGNGYTTVTIGNQTWLVQNLRVTQLRDGTKIAQVTDTTAWTSTTAPAYAYSNNDPATAATFGLLYNGYAAKSAICPQGYHVATDIEWDSLIAGIGGSTQVEKILSDQYWPGFHIARRNDSGFTGVPAGYRDEHGMYVGLNSAAYWWSMSDLPSDLMPYRVAQDTPSPTLNRSTGPENIGLSIRCVKDS